jgi:tetratricopeptide (TPR) repeat protein
VLTLLTSMASGADPRIGKMVAYELPEYTIYSTRSASQARNYANELAKFSATLEKLLGKRAVDSHMPTHLVILGRSAWEKYLQPRQNIAGWFQRGRFANYIVMNGDAEGTEGLHLIFHEYTHYYLSSQFAGEYPPWFNEGLAELMGYSKFDKGMAIILIPQHQVFATRAGTWIPFERLIRVDQTSPEYISHKLADNFYAQSWLTLHYGLIENRAFGKQMMDYVSLLNRLVPQAEAAKQTFGDLKAIDELLRKHSRNSDMHSGGVSLGAMAEIELPPGKPMADLDALALVADLMLETRLQPDRIRPVIDSLASREPDSARASIFAARLAILEENDAAFDAATARAEKQLKPGDLHGRRELGSVLLESAQDFRPGNKRSTEQSEKDLKRAQRLFGEVIKVETQDIEALWGFGASATQLNTHLDVAEQALVTAYKRMPANANISVALANLKGRQDKPEEMIPYLKDTIRYASDLGLRQWAADTLKQMEKWLAERDKVDEENRKQREAYEKQMAEYEKKYGKKKKAGQ